MLDSLGLSRKEVLSYELQYIYAFATKRAEVLEAQQPKKQPGYSTKSGRGTKKVTRKTYSEMLAAAKRQRNK